MRISDSRLGRFLSVDPITAKYPELTPYQFASNRPIDGIDEDGLEFCKYTFAGSYFLQMDMMKAGIQGASESATQGNSLALGYMKGSFGVAFTRLIVPMACTVGVGVVVESVSALGFWGIFSAVAYNPIVQSEIIGSIAAIAGYEGPDIPSPGVKVEQTFTRTWEEFKIVRQNGVIISEELHASAKLIMPTGSSFATQAEKNMAQKLLSEGNTVELVTETINTKGGRTADYKINGILTELKTISNMTSDDKKNAVNRLIKNSSGQGSSIILDFSSQEGITKDEIIQGINEYWQRGGKSKTEFRILGKDFDEIIKKTQ